MTIFKSWRDTMGKNNDTDNADFAAVSINELMMKQSVRATFKLPQELIELLGVIAGQLGIKQKSLLDQLAEDHLILNQLAQKAQNSPGKTKRRRQKTFVVSRSTLDAINTIARNQNIPRDRLVEISIKRLVPLIETELDKHNKRKTVLKEMKEYLSYGQKLKQRTQALLATDDLLFQMIEQQLELAEKNIDEAASIIEKGMPMEEW